MGLYIHYNLTFNLYKKLTTTATRVDYAKLKLYFTPLVLILRCYGPSVKYATLQRGGSLRRCDRLWHWWSVKIMWRHTLKISHMWNLKLKVIFDFLLWWMHSDRRCHWYNSNSNATWSSKLLWTFVTQKLNISKLFTLKYIHYRINITQKCVT